MKTRILQTLIVLALLAGSQKAFSLSTGFTYQGRLNDIGGPANGTYDLTFSVFDVSTGGSPVAGPVTNSTVAVANGLFTITLDFGNTVFNGNDLWLEIGVRTNGGGAFTALSPRRQQLTTVPYATYSLAAGVANSIASTTVVQGQSLNIGTNNTLNGIYSTITGGSGNSISGTASTVSGGNGNNVIGSDDSIGGGIANLVSSEEATIGGGYHNQVNGDYGTVAGGEFNTAGGDHSTVAGGAWNLASGTHSFVGGGSNNVAASDEDVVVGGINNSVSGDPAFIGAGVGNKVGIFNGIGFSGIALNSWIVAGVSNTVFANNSGIGGGAYNLIQSNANYSFIGGGQANFIVAPTNGSGTNLSPKLAAWSTIPGGYSNSVTGSYALAAGRRAKANYDGNFVWADSQDADFPSSSINQFLIRAAFGVGINKTNPVCALDVAGTIQGTYVQGTSGLSGTSTSGNGVYGYSTSGTAIRGVSDATSFGQYGVYGYGPDGVYGVDSLGDGAGVDGESTGGDGVFGRSTSGFGVYGTSTSGNGVYGGSTIMAGVAGVSSSGSGVHGISTTSSGVIGDSTSGNGVNGNSSSGYGVYGLSSSGTAIFGQSYGNTSNPQLLINQENSSDFCRLRMGVSAGGTWDITVLNGANPNLRFMSHNVDLVEMDAAGNVYANTFNPGSDRNSKQDFYPVNCRKILEQVVAIPIQKWEYKKDPATKHIGAMAQDFYAAFNVGTDDKHIATVDADGVALAAIQGLNQKLDEKDSEIQDLKKTMNELKTMVQSLAEKK
jgi:hypothetical protein